MIGPAWRAVILSFFLLVVASCGGSTREHWSTHTVGELCRYSLDFFTDHLRRPGLEVIDPTGEPDQDIDGYGSCILEGPKSGLSSLYVGATLEQADGEPVDGLTGDYEEREAIQVGADMVRVWCRDDDMGRELRVDIDGWTGHLVVILREIGEPTGDTALPNEHLPAAAEMLVRMTRDLKGPS
jgi:hypothetical protein